jgi:hypothetical protein
MTISSGHEKRFTRKVYFEKGVAELNVTPGDLQQPGKVVLLRWEDAEQAVQQARAHGQQIEGIGRTQIMYGIVGQKNVMLLSGLSITVEFAVDENAFPLEEK